MRLSKYSLGIYTSGAGSAPLSQDIRQLLPRCSCQFNTRFLARPLNVFFRRSVSRCAHLVGAVGIRLTAPWDVDHDR